MNKDTERRLLQVAMAVACLVPIGGGLAGVVLGQRLTGALAGVGPLDLGLDSHVRYLSGLLLAIGAGFAMAIPRIEVQGHRVTLLSGIVVLGGLARLYGIAVAGWPSGVMCAALVMELVIVPLIWLWQRRIARP